MLQQHWVKFVVLALAVPASAVFLYLLFRQSDEDEEDSARKVETSRQTVIQVTVPNKAVGAVIGHQGTVIKKIQEESGAQAHFSDSARGKDEDRTVLIRGDTDAAQKAEVMIRQIIADMPVIITEEIQVPGYCLGRIIGRGGESIREMSRVSNCKIFIDRKQDAKPSHAPRTVSITGPQTHIQLAKTLIEEKVEEEEAFRAKSAVHAANREQRKVNTKRAEDNRQKVSLPSRVVEAEGNWGSGDAQTLLAADSSVKEFMDVFVSALEHPGHFWVQIINSASLNLDKLVDDMTAFYSNADTAEAYSLQEVKAGDIVAAPFDQDRSWYRARVVGFEEDKIDLYFIDFGDNSLVTGDAVRALRPEYLSLPVQAIECKLANVKPVGERWSEEACYAFEDLSHCAEWKVLSARTVAYEPDSAGGQRPCLQLVESVPDQLTVDIAAELVNRGLAVWETPPPAAMGTVRSHSDPNPGIM